MKTTLVIHDDIMRRIKETAARRGTTISLIVESALRQFLEREDEVRSDLPPLPTRDFGRMLVDVSDRAALDRLFDEDKWSS